jgi:hypothetical protein
MNIKQLRYYISGAKEIKTTPYMTCRSFLFRFKERRSRSGAKSVASPALTSASHVELVKGYS